MLLELCETTLKDWLNESSSSLTVAMLDDMLLFALNIAAGVEFLHSKRVTFTAQRTTCRYNSSDTFINALILVCFIVCFITFRGRQYKLSSATVPRVSLKTRRVNLRIVYINVSLKFSAVRNVTETYAGYSWSLDIGR